jgi:RNA polymerase sigma-70 factor, ECF subfamily
MDVSSAAQFDAVFRSTYRRVFAYCLRRAPEPIAQDATAKVFSIAWRRRRDLPSDEAAVAWLLAIARRVIANELRGQQRRDRLLLRLSSSPATASAAAPDLTVKQALDELSPDDREVLRLVYWDELSHVDVAQVLGISVNAVAVRVHRARARFKAQIEQEARCRPTT